MKKHELEAKKDELGAKEASFSRDNPVDWQAAFVALAFVTTKGFVTSDDVSSWVEFVSETVDPRAGDELARIFNKYRTQFMQEFMG